mmetsp:Transcript_31377/g.48127  ORF Transcript_31377/g.48127 Transcript_31377/m.48127 type:complete len:88 (-) Transcript_31377:5-268(-)
MALRVGVIMEEANFHRKVAVFLVVSGKGAELGMLPRNKLPEDSSLFLTIDMAASRRNINESRINIAMICKASPFEYSMRYWRRFAFS